MKIISTLFLVLCVLVLSYLVIGISTVMKNGTSLTDKPGTLPRLKLFFSTNTASTSEQPTFPELQAKHYPLENAADIESFAEKVKTSAKSLGYEFQADSSDNKTLHFTITTVLFKFVDDLKITLELNQDQNKPSITVNAHSSSRTGRADFGANIANIKKFYKALNEAKP